MKKILTIASVLLLAAACNKPAAPVSTSQNQSPQNQSSPIQQTTSSPISQTDSCDHKSWKLIGNDIYEYNAGKGNCLYDVRVGEYDKGILTIYVGGSIPVSFVGNISKLDLSYWVAKPAFFYDGVTISSHLAVPNSTYSTNAVNFKCDGPFVTDFTIPDKYFYCQTNLADNISQFELTEADGVGFGTGGGSNSAWKKIYVKRINGQDIFLLINLVGEGIDIEAMKEIELADKDPDFCKVSETRYHLSFGGVDKCRQYIAINKEVPTQAYLDELLKDPKNMELILKADALFNQMSAAKQ